MHRRHDAKSSRLLLAQLIEIQKQEGFLGEERLKKLSIDTGIPLTNIYEVATFYSFLTTKPKGKYVIRLCESPSCYINKSTNILREFEKQLGIKAGQTTEDGLFTLELTSCIGCCDGAPAALVNREQHTKLTKSKVKKLVEECR